MSENLNDRKSILINYSALSAYYRQPLTDLVLGMYCDDLSEFRTEEILAAMSTYRKNPKNKFAPMPSQLIEIMNPNPSDDAIAREIVSKITMAVSKFGWSNPSEARETIGAAGWELIKDYGGWQPFCENFGRHISIEAFSAQAREVLKARISNGNNLVDALIALGEKSQPRQSVSEISHSDEKSMIVLKALNMTHKTI